MYHNFIGIDISKDEFHVAVYGDKMVSIFTNNKIGFIKFCKKYKLLLAETMVVMEATGGYEAALVAHLQDIEQVAVHRANPRVVKSFIRSLAKLGKSDAIDAHGLARYAKERHEDLALHVQASDVEQELVELTNRKTELK